MKSTNQKKSIRVVKREERARRESSPEQDAVKKSAQEAAREMVATVTGWVSELQHRHRTDTARALKTLFPETTPQIN